MRGVNDDEAVPLLRHALANDWKLRFIEQMPLDAGGLWARPAMVTADEIMSMLSAEFELTPVPARGSAPAEEFYVDGGSATVGIIASVSRPFCAACDRLRLTADGQFRNCLFAQDETDVRSLVRDESLSEDEIRQGIASTLAKVTTAKLPGHGINDPSFIQPTHRRLNSRPYPTAGSWRAPPAGSWAGYPPAGHPPAARAIRPQKGGRTSNSRPSPTMTSSDLRAQQSRPRGTSSEGEPQPARGSRIQSTKNGA